MNGLMLHCGAAKVEREEIFSAKTPNNTETWFPIPHSHLLTEIETRLTDSGFRVVDEAHGMTHDASRYFGLMELRNGHNAEDFNLVVGIRNSHDKKFPASLVLGSRVFVCDNLAFSGEVQISRRHTRNILRDLPELINGSMGKLGTLREIQDFRFDTYKKTEISHSEANDLLIRSLDCGIPVTKLPKILNEWKHPRHFEWREHQNLFRLFNAYTECLKGQLEYLPNRTQALHGLFDGFCGIVGETKAHLN